MTARPKRGLGKGLAALIPDADKSAPAPEPTEIEVALIKPRADQPRTHFAPEPLEELIKSIKSQGVLQPLLVTKRENKFILVAGERRLRASKAAGLVKVPCRVLPDLTERQILEISLVENLQREDLNPIELADGYRRLSEDLGLSHSEVAERVGKDRSTVVNTLRLLQLPHPVMEMVIDGNLSAGHARTILALDSEGEKVALAKQVVINGMSVRELEKEVQKKKQAPPKVQQSIDQEEDIHSSSLAQEIEDKLHMSVRISHRGPGGSLTIKYKDLDELDELISILKTSRE